jgi:hypothetical protein
LGKAISRAITMNICGYVFPNRNRYRLEKKLNNLAFFTQLALSYTINCYLRIINIELYGKKWNATLD